MDAIVLSGGGAFGAYEVGVMKALFDGSANVPEPPTGDIFTGTSVGAFNAVAMAMEPDSASGVRNLERIWLDEIAESGSGNGVLRIRGNPLPYFSVRAVTTPVETLTGMLNDSFFFAQYTLKRGAAFLSSTGGGFISHAMDWVDVSSLLSVEPLRQTIAREISYDNILKSSKHVRIIATDWENGKSQVYGEDRKQITTEHILASAAIPGIFPPVRLDKSVCVDGGVSMNTPIRPAIEIGADSVHIVSLDSRLHAVPAHELDSTLEALMRTVGIVIATAIREDMATAQWINRGIEAMRRAKEGADLSTEELRDFVKVAAQIEDRARRSLKLRPIAIHHYHPNESLGSPLRLLDFSRDALKQHISHGYRDARMHNCDDSGCVVPERGPR